MGKLAFEINELFIIMKVKPKSEINCLLDSFLSPEEEMRLCVSDCIPKRKLFNLNISDIIKEHNEWIKSGKNHFEFFFNLKEKFFTNKYYIKKNDNYEYWVNFRLKQIAQKKGVSIEEARLIFENNKLKKQINTKAIAIRAKSAEVKANKIKKEQTYAKYESLSFNYNVACIVIDYLNDTHKEYTSHIDAANDLGITPSNIVNVAAKKWIAKKKYCVIILKGIKYHNKVRKSKNDNYDEYFY